MNSALIQSRIKDLTPEEKFIALDAMWVEEHPQFDHRPARNIADFVLNPFFLGLKGQVWETPMQDMIDYYKSGLHEAWLLESIGAGKSLIASVIATYEVHKLLCLKNPQRFFNLSQSSKITILNMSVQAKQAYDIVFGEIKGKIDNSYWFKKYASHDDAVTSEYRFEKNLFILPGNSKETTPLGYSILVGILDEANFFTNTTSRDNALEVYNAMNRRIFSRFRGYGRLVVVSSPKYDGDLLSTKLEAGVPEDVFFRRRTLWEARKHDYVGVPMVKVEEKGKNGKGDDISIPETLVSEYKKDPDKFKRDFMAIAIGAQELYFKERDDVRKALCLKNNWIGHLSGDYKPSGAAYYGHIDLAKSKDACGIAIAHRVDAKIIVDFVVRMVAQPGGEIKFDHVRDIIYALKRRGFELSKITLDGWQSVDTIQQFNAKGIPSETLSVDRTLEPYDTLKEIIYAGGLECVNDPILKRELNRLELLKGEKVDHPKNGSKDLADAVCGAVYNCVVGEGMPEENQQYNDEFVDKVHVRVIPDNQLIEGVRRFMVIVPVLNGETALIWACVDKSGFEYYYRERIIKRATANTIVEVIAEAEEGDRVFERFYPIEKISKDVDHGFGLIEQLEDSGLDLTGIEYAEELASITIREGLLFDKEKPASVSNMPHIFFHPKCDTLIRSIKFLMNRKNFDNKAIYETMHKCLGVMVLAEPSW